MNEVFLVKLHWGECYIATEPHWKVNIGPGDDLVPSGNKPLPEPVLTKISDAIQQPQCIKSGAIALWQNISCLKAAMPPLIPLCDCQKEVGRPLDKYGPIDGLM